MLSMLKEALEWLNRPILAQGNRSWSLPKASIGSPEPPLPRLCSGEGIWRGKTGNETGDFSCAFPSQTASASRKEVEKNGSAQRDSNSRGASQDH